MGLADRIAKKVEQAARPQVEYLAPNKLPDKQKNYIVLGLGLAGEDPAATQGENWSGADILSDGAPQVILYNRAQIWVNEGEKGFPLEWYYTESDRDPINVLGHNVSARNANMDLVHRFAPRLKYWPTMPQDLYRIPAAIVQQKGRQFDFDNVRYVVLELNGVMWRKLLAAYSNYVADPSNSDMSIYGRVLMIDCDKNNPNPNSKYTMSVTGTTWKSDTFDEFVAETRKSLWNHIEGTYDKFFDESIDDLNPELVWAYIERELVERETGLTLNAFIAKYSLIDEDVANIDPNGVEVDLNPFN